MFIQEFGTLCAPSESVEVKLPRQGLKLDPRANRPYDCTFDCRYHDDGITVTLTRILDNQVHDDEYNNDDHDDDDDDDDDDDIEEETFTMRVYDPSIEDVPEFDSAATYTHRHTYTYTYLGVDGERAPFQTIVAIIHPSVHVIKREAFLCCTMMKRCILHDNIEIIEKHAFYQCCNLDALFLPSSYSSNSNSDSNSHLRTIEDYAFSYCEEMRILSLPLPPRPRQICIGNAIVHKCHHFFRIHPTIQSYEFGHWTRVTPVNNDQVHQSILDFYRDLSPLYKACLDIHVSAQSILECLGTDTHTDTHTDADADACASVNNTAVDSTSTDHGGTTMRMITMTMTMTPLHVLTLNPHADVDAILVCFHANMDASIAKDMTGKTPLDYLLDHHCNLDSHTALMTALCIHRNSMIE